SPHTASSSSITKASGTAACPPAGGAAESWLACVLCGGRGFASPADMVLLSGSPCRRTRPSRIRGRCGAEGGTNHRARQSGYLREEGGGGGRSRSGAECPAMSAIYRESLGRSG